MKIRQISLACEDIDRAKTFYNNVLKMEPTAVFPAPGMLFYDLDGTRLLLELGGAASRIYLQVEDVVAEVEQLRTEGVTIAIEPHVVFPDRQGVFDVPGNEWLAFIEDSEGNMIGLMSREAL
jgi:methylmalonyl-CoA/ethylmalonyl-CoA epimerase